MPAAAAAASGDAACGELRRNSNLDRAVADVERSQIVALHQTNEVVKPLNIEWLGRTGGVLRHSFTPH